MIRMGLYRVDLRVPLRGFLQGRFRGVFRVSLISRFFF